MTALRRAMTMGVVLLCTAPAMAADISGDWRTASGDLVTISDGEPHVVTIPEGQYAGMQIGSFSQRAGAPDETLFSGTVTDPTNGNTYDGEARLTDGRLAVKGCTLFGLLCQEQLWTRVDPPAPAP